MNQKTEEKEEKIFTKIAGVTFEGRQKNIDLLRPGFKGFLEREPENKFDSNAVKFMIYLNNKEIHLGYVSKMHAPDFAEAMDRGIEYEFQIEQITGTDVQNRGVNVSITRLK